MPGFCCVNGWLNPEISVHISCEMPGIAQPEHHRQTAVTVSKSARLLCLCAYEDPLSGTQACWGWAVALS